MDKLEQKINELRAYPAEEEWFEFKDNWYNETGIAEYISALSNAAAMHGEENAYLVWGVHNDTHELTGTSFTYHRDVKGEPLEHYLARQITPDMDFHSAN